MNFKDKVVLITGASSGIGASLAREFSRSGAHLILIARRAERLKALAGELERGGGKVLVFAADVSQDNGIEKVVAMARQTFSQIDVVVANAGFSVAADVSDLELEDFQRQFQTNVFGVLRTFYATEEALRKSKGRFAVIGSVMGYLTLPGNAAYAMSKYAVRALCNSLWLELRESGVSVTHIAPGLVISEIRRVGNDGKFRESAKDPVPQWIPMPSDVAARKIVAAIYSRSRERIITGHGWWIVWIERHFPWVIRAVLCWTGVRARTQPQD